MFDGGVRTGSDILRALALGAKSCMIGRAYIWGLGAGGQNGVAKAIDILRKELDVNMALCGVKNVRDIGRDIVMSDDAPGKPKTTRKR
jgi:L-lactate dehydrogenase (cytochrome)